MNSINILKLDVSDDKVSFASSIETARQAAMSEQYKLEETIQSVKLLKPECDKLDYALAASSGALCGLIDIFLVGKPGESPIGKLTDQWFTNRTMDFAKLCGWDGNGDASSAIRCLEKKFCVPYDQRGAGDAAAAVFSLSPKDHHFKSLGHNPTLLGLFFSILDQFTNQSHFVSGGELISLQEADGSFKLQGNSIPSKLFCGFANWFGHLVSDISGSSGSKGRGMGIPSPFWAWTNDIIAIKRSLDMPVSEFDHDLNELALSIYKKGYDFRFQTAQLMPVFINETIVRLMYAVRRMIKYFVEANGKERSASALWNACEPFTNPTVKRMLTVAHGTFCLIDLGDATMRGFTAGGGSLNVTEFFLRLNVAGVGRFTISLYGEAKRAVNVYKAETDARFAEREKKIIENYQKGLYELSRIYDDRNLVNFVDDLKCSDMYEQAFSKSAILAERRNVPEREILRKKQDIDFYFRGR